MRVHVDVLGWLFVLAGGTAALTGGALGCLAVGTAITLARNPSASGGWSHPLVVVFLVVGAVLLTGGAAMAAVGRALGLRRARARFWALVAGVVNLSFLPFGTALGIYTFWVLVNDEARREFGREGRDV
jgi:hypothetical protein